MIRTDYFPFFRRTLPYLKGRYLAHAVFLNFAIIDRLILYTFELRAWISENCD